jgi:two-component system, NtrC family, response regulator AtoC
MTPPTILVVDDEPRIRRILELSLTDLGYRVSCVEDVGKAQGVLAEERVDLVLTDLALPDRTGLDLLAELRAAGNDVPVILITAFGTVESAVKAIKLGAFDYVVKPFSIEELEALIQRALGLRRVERENTYLREVAAPAFEGMVASSGAMQRVIQAIEQVAPAPTTVLITGETGVGKELVARAIHARSPRANQLFVALNCAAIPAELLEAELFGVTKGAFTGAVADRAGKFELADGGTLFLDEIGDLPPAMQPKLLRTLQEGSIERLGSNTLRHVDVRIVAATHRDIPAMVAEERFRADLFYRLNVFPIAVPPLRDRPEDIPPLAQHAVARLARTLARAVRLSPDALDRLRRYTWPGNVRELNNVLERAVLLARGDVITQLDIPAASATAPALDTARAPGGSTLREAVERAAREAILAALEATGDNKTRAAARLGVSVRTLWYKIDRLGLAHAGDRPEGS